MYLKLKITNLNDYLEIESNSLELEILSNFLRSDIGDDEVSSYKNWVLNPEYEDTAGNLTFIEKENGKIIIGYLYAKDPYEVVFEATQEQFLNILDQWAELCKSKPKEIVITKEDDTITLAGKN